MRYTLIYFFLIFGLQENLEAAGCKDPTTFGDACEYKCHCVGDATCDSQTGACPNGCANGWEGEYCQRGNIATEATGVSQSSTDRSYHPQLAVDGKTGRDINKCTLTNQENEPWWRVDFGKDFVVFAVQIWNIPGGDIRVCRTSTLGEEYRGTKSTTRNNKTCLSWTSSQKRKWKMDEESANYCRNPDGDDVGIWCYTPTSSNSWHTCDIPECQKRLKNFQIKVGRTRCKRHPNYPAIDYGASPVLQCDNPTVGKNLTIKLGDDATYLALCEVRIIGFQYKACLTKHYGPNCNNECQCAKDEKCDDATGRCPSGCNDRFTGPYCNIEIPEIRMNSSTPTSLYFQWHSDQHHDSAYDAGEIKGYFLKYNSTLSNMKTSRWVLPGTAMRSFINLTSLQPSTEYSVRVQIKYKTDQTGKGYSPLGSLVNYRTEPCTEYMRPPKVNIYRNKIDTNHYLPRPERATLSVQVKEPNMASDCIAELELHYKAASERNYSFVESGRTSITKSIYDLMPYTDFDIRATVRSPDGNVEEAVVRVTTAEDTPLAPSLKTSVGPTSIAVTIVPPDPPLGNITKYWLSLQGPQYWQIDLKPTQLTRTFTDLSVNREFYIRVQAFTSVGGGDIETVKVKTQENKPGPPESLEITERMTDSVVLNWTKPIHPNGKLLPYKVKCTTVYSYDETVNNNRATYDKEFDPEPEVNGILVSGLKPATKYNCSVQAQTSKGYGPSFWQRNWTKAEESEVPAALFPQIFPDQTTSTTITIEIPKMPQLTKTGSVGKLQIAIETLNKNRRKRSVPLQQDELGLISDHRTAKMSGSSIYITAELNATFSGQFVVGDGLIYGGFYNSPLVEGNSYDVIFGIEYRVGEESTIAYRRYGQSITVGGDATSAGLVIGVVMMILVLVLALLAFLYIRRKKRLEGHTITELVDLTGPPTIRRDRKPGINKVVTLPRNGTPSPALIRATSLPDRSLLISELAAYIKRIRGNGEEEFEEEFKSLPKNIVKSVSQAKSATNIELNRYKNIVTYDHSRVVLLPLGDETSDYINASYIHGYNKKNAFIAAQGPIPTTKTAMWRMIWQERCTRVVMLTRLVEKGKVKSEQYWPSKGKETYGPFTVQLAEQCTFTDYVKRVLKVTLYSDVRIVTQFHFTAWPDHDVPRFACSLLNFRVHVLQDADYGKVPIFVHCSAGVGRTGTFIGIDYLIRQGKAERRVNMYDCVLSMREQRPNMVQNVGQYRHVHDAILEFFKIGTTYILSDVFPEEYTKMTQPMPGKATSGLENQFSILGSFTEPIIPSERAIKNRRRNRSQNITPDDRSRVVLSLPVNGWDDYVNAIYATGYGEKDSYIITQMPLPDTAKDLWRIVADTGVSTIVMMNFIDGTYELTPVYWPNENERIEFGPLVVDGLDMDTSARDVIVRDFTISRNANISGKGGMAGRTVRHFQLQSWPDGKHTPASAESIVELLELVERWQQKVEKKKILVHCLDGASQSGVFCVAHSVIEKVKVDHVVDVFQYLRLLRANRPQLVNTYEQYRFIHEVVLKYLQGFDTYANFS